ncbi:hypothetical protein V9K92_02845 [Phyllobacterium sp. CCNWLW109]|uniref:hypothetical protein n=1 Tax=Phyllobacterium sp. CCNWLW109 TaxID=3127479 RepID=UPI0030784101
MFPSFVTLRVIVPPLRVSRVNSADIAGIAISITTTPNAEKIFFQQDTIVMSLLLMELLVVTMVNLSG